MWFSCFLVLPGSAETQVIWGGIVKRLLIACFIGNISAEKYQNLFMCVKVIASQRWDVFWDTVYFPFSFVKMPTDFENCFTDRLSSKFLTKRYLKRVATLPCEIWMSEKQKQLECGPMPNVMAALPNGAVCSTPQSLADAHYWSSVQ